MTGTKLPRALRNELRVASKTVRRKQGSLLFRAGTRARGAYLVRRGKVRLTLEGGTGLYPARLLGPGAVVGLPATVSGEPYSLTAEAILDCELDFIPRRELLNLIQSNAAVAFHILQILSEEIFQMRNTAQLATRETSVTVRRDKAPSKRRRHYSRI
jgi:CRP-like cAMP-binding protein